MRTLELEYIKNLNDPFLDKVASQGLFFYSKFEFIVAASCVIAFTGWLIYKLYIGRKIDNYAINPSGLFARFFTILHDFFWVVFVVFIISFYAIDLKYSANVYLEPDIRRGNTLVLYRSAYMLKVPGTRKFSYQLNLPVRGDYVKYYLPGFSGSSKLGRVVGLPNEKVELDLEKNIFRINGEERRFYFSVSKLLSGKVRPIRWRVPENTVLVVPNFINESIYASLRNRDPDGELTKYYTQSTLVSIQNILGKVIYIW